MQRIAKDATVSHPAHAHPNDATALPACTIRVGTSADLPSAAPIYRHADADDRHVADGSPEAAEIDAAVLDDLALLLAGPPGSVQVAEVGGEIVGFAGASIVGRHWHLVYLFVEPARHGRGIGGRLLAAVHRAGIEAGCGAFTTEPSADPRALTAYVKLGMLPRPPAVRFSAIDPAFPAARWDDALGAVPVTPEDGALLATIGDIDAVVRGGRRPHEHERWLAGGGAAFVLTRHGHDAPAGYAVIQREGRGRWRLGPIAAMDADLVPGVVNRSLIAAAAQHRPGDRWRLDLPGENHAAIPPLLAAWFRPERLFPLLASGPVGRWDRYVFAGLDQL